MQGSCLHCIIKLISVLIENLLYVLKLCNKSIIDLFYFPLEIKIEYAETIVIVTIVLFNFVPFFSFIALLFYNL